MEIKRIGVIGGGSMGAGIIQTLSGFGFPVLFKDISEKLVHKCLDQIIKIYSSALEKGKLTEEEMKRGISLIQGGTDYNDFNQVDLVIETVPEDMEIKKRVFIELDGICRQKRFLLATRQRFLFPS